jgi:uncharacterized protein YggE
MNTNNFRDYIWVAGTTALLGVTFAALAMGVTDVKSWHHVNGQAATISVSGEGEVTAVPDIATVTMTVRESAKTVPDAQKLAEAKIAKGLEVLAKLGVEKKDTKTLSYTISPKYESQQVGYCSGYVCPPGKTVITGYEVAQTLQVKVRKVDQAGEIFGVLGGANITEISGPEFTVDDMDKVKAEAKEKAIANAKAKAEATAKSLGVSLGVITAFSEDAGGYYAPMLMRAEAAGAQMDKAVSVSLPLGENVIKSNVSITYSLD